jgi:hypothetical protein
MAIQAALAEELAGLQDGDYRFLALLGEHSKLHLAFLDVKHRVRDVALREHVLIPVKFQDRFSRTHLGKKFQGVERVLGWVLHDYVLRFPSAG